MRFGYFDNENKEYVITNPKTPTPWMNYIGKGKYSGIISNTGGGLSFDGDPSNRRVLRYKFNNLPKDRPGRYIYIRNQKTGEYWSPMWQPVMKLDSYECRHGMGYTVIKGEYDGISVEVTYFVPTDKNYELWHVDMKNLTDEAKDLKVFSYCEFSWHDAKYDMLCHWPCMAFTADYKNGRITVDNCAEHLTGVPLYDYISTDLEIDGYDCSLEEFIGPYRSETNPIAVEKGECKNSEMHSDNCVGVLSSSFSLAAKEEKSFNYTLGAASKKEDIDLQINDALHVISFEKEKEKLKQEWNKYFSCYRAETPSQEMDVMVNIWNAYQAKTTFDWSRFISLYERGVDRGFGFRDSMQDVLGVMHAIPRQARERIVLLLSIQKNSGDAKSVYYPATNLAEGGGRSDDHLWSVFSVCNYIKETGDFSFLDREVPYVDGGNGTVLEHLEKGIEFTMKNLGAHGIPDMFRNDWNDSIWPISGKENRGAESVFVFFQLGHAAYELIELYKKLGKKESLEKIQKVYDYCREKTDVVWDGEWFIRAFTQTGEKYGTNEDEWNKIYLNPQSWSVLSRLPDKQRQNTAMDNVLKYLYTDKGIKTHHPASTGFNPENKDFYLFEAGARENGSIFFHSNTWAIIALCLLGRKEDAFKCYQSILPIYRNDIADKCLTEPYVFSQTMLAEPHGRKDACVNSWLTGTASWTFLAATQYILGIRPEYDGLSVDPCVPDEWKGFRVNRLCRGTECHISVEKGSKNGLFVDGKRVEGNQVPWSELEGKEKVDILLVK